MSEEDEYSNEKMEIVENVGNETDTSDSNSSDDETKELQKERELETIAKDLEKRISKNLYDYNAYVELVHTLRQLMDLTRLRTTFERFSSLYPLTGELWLLWIKCEISIASSDEDKKRIIELFEKAIADYLSVNVWLEYVQFAMGYLSVDDVRKLFERALSTAGLHVAQGSLIWDALREFEMAHLSLITNVDSDEWIVQAQRVATIFKRQLSVPLCDMDLTLKEFHNWLAELPKVDFISNLDEYKQIYENSQEHLVRISSYEDALMTAKNDDEKFEYYNEYFNFEKNNPVRLNNLYERAVADIPLNAELWRKYCMHAVQLGPETFALDVCKRSVRNCSWNANIWVYYLRTLELFGKDHKKITEEFEQALSACSSDAESQVNLWLCYLEHCRRIVAQHLNNINGDVKTDKMETDDSNKVQMNEVYLRKVFNRAVEHLTDTWGSKADSFCTILQFWARTEAFLLKDMEEARKIWNKIMRQGHSATASMWLEYLALEIRHGDTKHIRKLYLRALNATKDWLNTIVESWINYERDNGTIQTMMDCTTKCYDVLTKWRNDQQQQQTHNMDDTKQKLERTGKRGKMLKEDKSTRNTTNVARRERRAKSIERKRKSDSESEDVGNENKKTKTYETELSAISELKVEEESPEKRKEIEQKSNREMRREPPIEMDADTEARTVFISNLDYSVDEEQIKQFFGDIKHLRLVKDYKGRSKGFGYVELNSPEEVEKTLKRDRERLNGRPIFISRCKTAKEKREATFKYATNREQHKLFVKGLPLTCTKDELEKLFEQYGKIKDIRMACYRNGHFKGIAYVEFENASDAARALVKTDNMQIDGHTINVAISDPPRRNLRDSNDAGHRESTMKKSRLQIPLIPTVLQKKIQDVSVTEPKKIKSNADFREMLLKH